MTKPQEARAPTPRRDDIALHKVLDKNPTLYVDIRGEPMIELPLDGLPDCKRPYPLRSSRARAAIHSVICRDAQFLPYVDEVARILWVLEDMAWQHARAEAPYHAALEQHELIE